MRQAKLWVLLFVCLNLALLAMNLGWLTSTNAQLQRAVEENGESQRLSQQLHQEHIRLTSASVILPAADKHGLAQTIVTTMPAPASAASVAQTADAASAAFVSAALTPTAPRSASTPLLASLAANTTPAAVPRTTSAANLAATKSLCFEIGAWTPAQAKQTQTAWMKTFPDTRITILERKEQARWWVHMPPRSNRAEADKKAGELRYRGVTNFTMLHEPPTYPNTLSLGLFQSKERAEAYLNTLRDKDVRTATITERAMFVNKAWLQVANLPVAQEKTLRDAVPRSADMTVQTCR